MWVLPRNAIKAGSPDWAAQLQECRGWWRGECDDIFELCLFTHLSTKIKIQQPRGAESQSAWLQRAGRTDLLLLPLGEMTTTARKTLNLFGIVKSYKFTKLKNFIKFKINAVSPYFVSDHVGIKRPRQGADTFAVRVTINKGFFIIVSPSSQSCRHSYREIRNLSYVK